MTALAFIMILFGMMALLNGIGMPNAIKANISAIEIFIGCLLIIIGILIKLLV